MTAKDALAAVMVEKNWASANVAVATDLSPRTVDRILAGGTVRRSTLKTLKVCIPEFAKRFDGKVAA